MANLVSGKNLILNPRRIYTLQDKISEQPISLFDTDIVNDRYGNARQIHPGRCYDFLGTNEYVAVPDTSDFTFGDGSTDLPFSLSAWVNMDTTASFPIITKEDEWVLALSGASVVRLTLFDNGGTSNSIIKESTSGYTATGTWAHFTVTYSGSGTASGMNIYIDGIKGVDISGAVTGVIGWLQMYMIISSVLFMAVGAGLFLVGIKRAES